jgi:hypothetical protein
VKNLFFFLVLPQTIEDFFSKDINTVITDAPLWKIRNPTNNPNSVSPGTPCSQNAIANSPWSPAVNGGGGAEGGGGGVRKNVSAPENLDLGIA